MNYFIIIRGPLGIGKTTIAKKLKKILKAEYISMDEIVDNNMIIKKQDKNGMIDVRNFLQANKVIIPIVNKILKEGKNIIVDGNFYHKEQIIDLINKLGKDKVLVFDLKAPIEVCIERDKKRKIILGKDAARAVFNAVNRFSYGVKINTNKKTEDETVKEILKHIKLL